MPEPARKLVSRARHRPDIESGCDIVCDEMQSVVTCVHWDSVCDEMLVSSCKTPLSVCGDCGAIKRPRIDHGTRYLCKNECANVCVRMWHCDTDFAGSTEDLEEAVLGGTSASCFKP